MDPVGLLITAVGLFSLSGAVFDWEWFMNNRKARPIVGIFGRSGARIFYALLGAAFVTAGMLMVLGVIQTSR